MRKRFAIGPVVLLLFSCSSTLPKTTGDSTVAPAAAPSPAPMSGATESAAPSDGRPNASEAAGTPTATASSPKPIEASEVVSSYDISTMGHSCDDNLKDCEKAVKTHPPDKNGCMPVECKAGTENAYFRYIKDPILKAKAFALEKESRGEHPPTLNVVPSPTPPSDVIPPN